MQKDKRLFEREPIIIEIKPKGELPGKLYRLRDISKDGFNLETDQLMAVGDHIDFSFSLPDGENNFRLCGKVVWVEKISSTPESYYIGFAFHMTLDKLPPELFSLPLTKPEEAILK